MVNKTKIIGLLLLLYSFLAYSQVCEQAKKLFENDLYSSKELREYASKAEDSDKVFDAWQILHNENLATKTNATILKEVENNYQAITNADGYLKWKNVTGAGDVGTYTTKIKWGILDVDARPFRNKGYWGKRIAQNDARVDVFELKVNPSNESFYVEHPNGGFVQFENLNANALQDGKMVLQPNNSFYRVYDKPEFLRQKVLDEAIRQTQAANAKGLTAEWLVSDQTVVNQLTQFFAEKNVNVVVKYLAE